MWSVFESQPVLCSLMKCLNSKIKESLEWLLRKCEEAMREINKQKGEGDNGNFSPLFNINSCNLGQKKGIHMKIVRTWIVYFCL